MSYGQVDMKFGAIEKEYENPDSLRSVHQWTDHDVTTGATIRSDETTTATYATVDICSNPRAPAEYVYTCS